MIPANAEKQDFSISMLAANLYSLIIALPLCIGLLGVYALRRGTEQWLSSFHAIYTSPWFILSIIVGVIVHELLHAVGWRVFGHLAPGAVTFGIHLKTLTPYAHCTERLDIRAYRLGGLLPGLVLGFIPAALGLITGNPWLINFGTLFTLAASGDLLSLWLLRNVPKHSLIEDHPSRVGCYVYPARPHE